MAAGPQAPSNTSAEHKKASTSKQSNFRAWSCDLPEDSKCTIYKIRMAFGWPVKVSDLPAQIRSRSKAEVVDMLYSYGFRGAKLQGTKQQLLERYARDAGPYVEYEIDSRECLQRVLSVALDHFRYYDDEHLFHATMPGRGANMVGRQKFSQNEHFINATLRGPFRTSPDDYIKRVLRCADLCELEQTVLHRIAAGVDGEELTGIRRVRGSAFSPTFGGFTTMMIGCADAPEGGFLSLDDMALQHGDKIYFLYDFGAKTLLTATILDVRTEQPLIEEKQFNDHNTQARITASEGKAEPQYPQDEEEYASDLEVDDDDDQCDRYGQSACTCPPVDVGEPARRAEPVSTGGGSAQRKRARAD